MEHGPSLLAGWESYYVIIGSSAAALTGLQFVVVALIAEMPRRSSESIAAFGTPTVVHFCMALLVSGVLSAPWPTVAVTAYPLAAIGVGGSIYAAIVTRRAFRQTVYEPVAEDWLWHVVLPLAAYLGLLAAAMTLGRFTVMSLFAVAGFTLLLIYIGIHNAWDSVAYVATQIPRRDDAASSGAQGVAGGQGPSGPAA